MQYQTNEEYRACIRQFAEMCTETDIFKNDNTIDPITRDEYFYDAEAMSRTMDILYDKTKKSPAFIKLYELAAGRMFSTDCQIGLCVLLSYDFFSRFYPIYTLFETMCEDVIKDPYYVLLLGALEN